MAPILGSITAIACWLGSAKALEGSVTILSTAQVLPLVIGNATSLICGLIYSVICTYMFGPDDFDWELFKTGIRAADDSDVKGVTAEQLAQQLKNEQLSPEDDRSLRRAKKLGIIFAVVGATLQSTCSVADRADILGPLCDFRHPLAATYVWYPLYILTRLLPWVGGRDLPNWLVCKSGHHPHAIMAGSAYDEGLLEVCNRRWERSSYVDRGTQYRDVKSNREGKDTW